VQPADIYILAGLLATDESNWTYRELARLLNVPHPLVQRALQRAEEADLYSSTDRTVQRPNMEEFLLHGLRYLAPVKLGAVVSGVPAAWGAPPMVRRIHESGGLPPVWPAANGRTRGQALPPLHKAAVAAITNLPRLGELLALIDSLRAGDMRVRSVAAELLDTVMRAKPSQTTAPA
jgi:hypothetical protein